jgi:hypothetical protein
MCSSSTPRRAPRRSRPRSGFGISHGARYGPERQEWPPADHPPAFWEKVQGGVVREQDARCVSSPPRRGSRFVHARRLTLGSPAISRSASFLDAQAAAR